MEYEIHSRSRQCHSSGRELQPGEVIYSALIETPKGTTRKDFASENWQGPPEQCLGWWKCTIPLRDPNRVYWAPHSVIWSLFDRLAEDPTRADVRYLLALVMIRRKMIQLEETSRDDDGTETLVVNDPRNNGEIQIPVISVDRQRSQEIERELIELLFSHERPADETGIATESGVAE
jgi:hypothetical protein